MVSFASYIKPKHALSSQCSGNQALQPISLSGKPQHTVHVTNEKKKKRSAYLTETKHAVWQGRQGPASHICILEMHCWKTNTTLCEGTKHWHALLDRDAVQHITLQQGTGILLDETSSMAR